MAENEKKEVEVKTENAAVEAKAEKKPAAPKQSFFKRAGARISKFLREYKSELKKIVWVVIIKNGKRVTYGDCIVTDVNEDGSLNDKVVEKMTISALTRKVG